MRNGECLDRIDERDDHYLGLPGAKVVATEALMMVQDNLH